MGKKAKTYKPQSQVDWEKRWLQLVKPREFMTSKYRRRHSGSGRLSIGEVESVCEDAVVEACAKFDPRKSNNIKAFYEGIVDLRMKDALRRKGFVKCPNCDGGGVLEGTTCPYCINGYLGNRETTTVSAHTFVARGIKEEENDEGLDPRNALVLTGSVLQRFDDLMCQIDNRWYKLDQDQAYSALENMMVEIRDRLNVREREIFVGDALADMIPTNAVYAQQLRTSENSVSKLRQRARRKVEEIVRKHMERFFQSESTKGHGHLQQCKISAEKDGI